MKYILICILLVIYGCGSGKKDDLKLRHYSFNEPLTFRLPDDLNEISGLAYLNNKLYAHNDETGIIYVIDYESGKAVKSFQIGLKPVKQDFEGIAAAGEYIYLITSAGELYRFTEPDSGYAQYRIFRTPLTKHYDVEGLCYDEKTNTLLIACKSDPKQNKRNARAVFAFDIGSGKLISRPRFIISPEVLKDYGINNFSPSGIEQHEDGNFYIISSSEKAVVVLSPEGELLEASRLPSAHRQPEGITFLSNNDLVIADEGKNGSASLTVYSFNRGSE